MSKDLNQLKKEIRADFALIWGSQRDSNTRMEALASQLDQQAELIAEANRRVEESMRLAARLGREVVAAGDQTAGRLKQLDGRFITLLDALEKRQDRRYESLERRVARLEKNGDPAA